MQFRTTITIDAIVEAESSLAVEQLASAIALPKGVLLTKPISVEVKEHRPEDNRLLTNMPNVTQERKLSLIEAMTDVEQIIITLCIRPTESHDIYTAVRLKYPTIDLYVIAQAIARLKNEGWLTVMRYHVERSWFPTLNVQAESTKRTRSVRR